jgi:hypothetical protein
MLPNGPVSSNNDEISSRGKCRPGFYGANHLSARVLIGWPELNRWPQVRPCLALLVLAVKNRTPSPSLVRLEGFNLNVGRYFILFHQRHFIIGTVNLLLMLH